MARRKRASGLRLTKKQKKLLGLGLLFGGVTYLYNKNKRKNQPEEEIIEEAAIIPVPKVEDIINNPTSTGTPRLVNESGGVQYASTEGGSSSPTGPIFPTAGPGIISGYPGIGRTRKRRRRR